VPLENYALASLAELKAYMGGLTGTNQDESLNQAINGATALIEGRLGRLLVSRGEFTEWHTVGPRDRFFELYTSEWPIIAIGSVHEDDGWPRTYGPDTLLAVGADYEYSKPEGWVRRVGGSGPIPWKAGTRIAQFLLTTGYQDLDGEPASALTVPYDLKKAALFVAASIFKESERQRWGVSAITDAVGTVTRFLGHFPDEIQKDLRRYERREFHRTWERAA
jgi:hypothetical protein